MTVGHVRLFYWRLALLVLFMRYSCWLKNATGGGWIHRGRPRVTLIYYMSGRPVTENVSADLPSMIKEVPQGVCVNRFKVRHEFSRVLGVGTHENVHVALVVGSHTAVGKAVVNVITESGGTVAEVGCINELDFGSPDASKVLTGVYFQQAVIAYQPGFPRHSESDGGGFTAELCERYFNGLARFLVSRNARFVLSAVGPVLSSVEKIVLAAGGTVVHVPYIVDSEARYDMENPLLRVVKECGRVNRGYVESFESVELHSITARTVARFVCEYMLVGKWKAETLAVSGYERMSIESAIGEVLKVTGLDNCEVQCKIFPHTWNVDLSARRGVVLGERSRGVRQLLGEQFVSRNLSDDDTGPPYCSIVIAGRNDDYARGFIHRIGVFLSTVNSHIKNVPLANVELLIVDYATPSGRKGLRDILRIGEFLAGKVRFIVVPEEKHEEIIRRKGGSIHFLEYVAKNVAIRRARGDYVLTTNVDNILSVELFELIAARRFSPGVLYRAVRYSVDRRANKTIKQIMRGVNEPWLIREWPVSASWPGLFHYAVIDSLAAFHSRADAGASGDFIMLSKSAWLAIAGFNEFPVNWGVDTLFSARMMKFAPGLVRMVMYPPIIHQNHDDISSGCPQMKADSMAKYELEYICTGSCFSCGQFGYDPLWGCKDDVFVEYRQ